MMRARGTLGRLTDEAGGIYHRLHGLEQSSPELVPQRLRALGKEIDALRSQLSELVIKLEEPR